MASQPPPHFSVSGIHEDYQGPWDFENLSAYIEGWIKPNIMGDLETVFVGARQLWEQRNPPAGKPGRGDFSMATALVSVMDHLGACLVESPDHWIAPGDNIARVAKHLKSTWDIYALFADMGRHALVHGAWPQTSVPFRGTNEVVNRSGPEAEWAFGLSFNANSNPQRHDTLHDVPWPHKNFSVVKVAPTATLVKLVLNVQMLRWELLEFIEGGRFKSLSPPEAFDRVKVLSQMAGNPYMRQNFFKEAQPRRHKQLKFKKDGTAVIDQETGKQVEDLVRKPGTIIFERHDVREQILKLRVEAKRLHQSDKRSEKNQRDHDNDLNTVGVGEWQQNKSASP